MEHEVTLDVAQGLLPAAARACEQEVCEHEGIAGLAASRPGSPQGCSGSPQGCSAQRGRGRPTAPGCSRNMQKVSERGKRAVLKRVGLCMLGCTWILHETVDTLCCCAQDASPQEGEDVMGHC